MLVPLQVYLGDHTAGAVLPSQLSKLEALEGNWGQGNTGYVIFAIPDQQAQRNIAMLSIPCLGSAITKDLSCKTATPGLDLTPRENQPLMAAVFWGFRAMFYAALWMWGIAFYATIQRFRRKLWTARRFHRFVMWASPAGILAIWGGWITAESGRQPWVVFGHLRTADAVSHLAPGEVLFSVVGFSLLYLTMLVAYIAYIVHTVRVGPERDHPDLAGEPQPASEPVLTPGAMAPGIATGR
jgi:cytochrome d ubiquinol oxidase subunit I